MKKLQNSFQYGYFLQRLILEYVNIYTNQALTLTFKFHAKTVARQ